MSASQASQHEPEHPPVPPLQLAPRLQAVGDGYVASLRTAAGLGLRAGLIALVLALVITSAVFLITHHPRQVDASATVVRLPTAHGRLRGTTPALIGAQLTLRGVPLTARFRPAAPSRHTAVTPRSYAHELSTTDLTELVDGTSVYEPAPYLVADYRLAAARYHIPWRLLAAVEYINGDYVNAVAGPSARPEQALAARVGVGGQRAINAHVLARVTSAASKPSLKLLATARTLAADGVAAGPAHGLATYLSGTVTTPQTVLTLAQEIGAAAVSSATPPLAKVHTMLSEAKLLNGLPYVWGGGHVNPAWVVGSGYDCSGFVSEVLHSAGYLTSPVTTQTLPGAAGIANGPGKYVTLYDRTIATLKVWVRKKKNVTIRQAVNPASAGVHLDRGRRPNALGTVSIRLPRWVGQWKTIKLKKLVKTQDTTNNDEHVIIDIAGQWWESGGSSSYGGASMVHPIAVPSHAYLKTFNRILHPQGL